jgi:hypothetical protein
MRPAANSRFWRLNVIWAFATSTCDLATSALRWSTCCSNGVGSSSASSCPLLTWLLKSAWRRAMMPDTWLPTCTVVTAETVPVALTVMVTLPRVAGSVR